jgi:hypothetical protein
VVLLGAPKSAASVALPLSHFHFSASLAPLAASSRIFNDDFRAVRQPASGTG